MRFKNVMWEPKGARTGSLSVSIADVSNRKTPEPNTELRGTAHHVIGRLEVQERPANQRAPATPRMTVLHLRVRLTDDISTEIEFTETINVMI